MVDDQNCKKQWTGNTSKIKANIYVVVFINTGYNTLTEVATQIPEWLISKWFTSWIHCGWQNDVWVEKYIYIFPIKV